MKVLFLDVDGVLISAAEHIRDELCSLDRKIPKTPVAIINLICERTGAKVVMNTTHNREYPDLSNIEDCMIGAGFNKKHFFEGNTRTRYPEIGRKEAVLEWVRLFLPEADYVCVDDDPDVSDNKEVVELINSEVGITITNMNNIITRWGGKPAYVLL